jgi:ribose transport system substrate-binding protein
MALGKFLRSLLLVAVLLAPVSRLSALPERRRPVIALIMKSLANEFFLTMEEGAKEHQARNAARYELITRGIKDEGDVEQQIRIVEQMIAIRVDAIVLAPADSEALVPICRAAAGAHILVVNIDNRLDASALAEKGLRVPYSGPNNVEGAREVGDYLAARLEPGDKVAIVEGVPTAQNSKDRTRGFSEAMETAGMRIVDVVSGYWEMESANAAAITIMSEFPDIKAILCGNDNMALGVVAAINAAGRSGRILVTGFDDISAATKLLKQDKLLVTADQHGDRIAVAGIETALAILGGSPPADRETSIDLVTK